MATGWYVLHTYSGYEDKIERALRMMLEDGDLDGEVLRDIKVLKEQVTEVKDGKKRTQTRKIYPGYVLLQMDMPELEPEWKGVCSKFRTINGVTGFVGTPPNKRPSPLPAEEARTMLQKAGELKGERVIRARQSFAPGEQVKITGGPFETFIGTIDEVNLEKSKLKVMVGIFGRNAPVEVDMNQVEKV